MPVKKAPKKFIVKKKTLAPSRRVAPLKTKVVAKKVSAVMAKRPVKVTLVPQRVVKTNVTAIKARAKGVRVFPDFSDVDDLLRFSALLYLLALMPLASYLTRSASEFYPPRDQKPKIILADKTPMAEVPARAVLGEQTAEEDLVPLFPKWLTASYQESDLSTPTEKGEIEAVSLDYQFEAGDLLVGATGGLLVWETILPADQDDLYNFYVATPSTARVYLDDELLLDKNDPEAVSQSEAQNLTLGEHALRVELDAHPDTPSFQFLFY